MKRFNSYEMELLGAPDLYNNPPVMGAAPSEVFNNRGGVPTIENNGGNTPIPPVPPTPVIPDFIDLGLSVKFASHNIGADAPEGYGDYFAWGETTAKTVYDWSTYKYANGDANKLTKYCPSDKTDYWDGEGEPDNTLTLESMDDIAAITYGEGGRMPSKSELEELMALPSKFYVLNGVNGRMFCKTSDVVSQPNIDSLENGFYFYDAETDFTMNLAEELNIDGIKYMGKAEFVTYLDNYLREDYGYSGPSVDVDTMIFADEEHTTLLVYGTDYEFGVLKAFDPMTMLFIPFAGYFFGSELSRAGSSGNLWTSAVDGDYPNNACYFNFYADYMDIIYSNRYSGFSVRGVSGL